MTSRTEPDPAMALCDVPRNDLGAARRFYEARGPLRADEMEALIQLQDNPRALKRASRQWRVIP